MLVLVLSLCCSYSIYCFFTKIKCIDWKIDWWITPEVLVFQGHPIQTTSSPLIAMGWRSEFLLWQLTLNSFGFRGVQDQVNLSEPAHQPTSCNVKIFHTCTDDRVFPNKTIFTLVLMSQTEIPQLPVFVKHNYSYFGVLGLTYLTLYNRKPKNFPDFHGSKLFVCQ